jgi:hypothetical protein
MEVLLGAVVSLIVQATKGRMSRNLLHVIVLALAVVVAVILYFAQIFPSVDMLVEGAVAIAVSAIGIYEVIIKRVAPYIEKTI